jgi:hypothetical protein
MQRKFGGLAAAGGLLLAALAVPGALAQKSGGVLRMYHFDSPASMSLHEEVTFATLGPMQGSHRRSRAPNLLLRSFFVDEAEGGF